METINKGIIYLIQPAELVGTNRYKIGMSNSPDLERCRHGYKKGSRYLAIMECNNPLVLEQNIKKIFNVLPEMNILKELKKILRKRLLS